MSIILNNASSHITNFDKTLTMSAEFLKRRISLVSSFQCYCMANAPGLKNSQFLTGQTGVSISRSFLREKPWSFRHP